MTIQEMQEKKREYGYTNEMIAELSGVPLGTVQKVFCGETKHPRRDTVIKLEKLLSAGKTLQAEQNEQIAVPQAVPYKDDAPQKKNDDDTIQDNDEEKLTDKKEKKDGSGIVRKPEQKSGAANFEYSVNLAIKDYYLRADGKNVELIDGIVYEAKEHTTFRRLVAGDIYVQLQNYAMNFAEKYTCIISPVDVQLEKDDKTMVQPDVIMVGNPHQIHMEYIEGAPDFALEIISPVSRKRDYVDKLKKYMDAGVREYWIVDCMKKEIYAYYFDSEELMQFYSLGDYVPVGIFDGKFKVDFSRIAKLVDTNYTSQAGTAAQLLLK